MYTVKQVSKMAGVTPRTLHYYDEIGLLEPARVAENGYRYYSDESLLRLQQILFYRELGLPLEKIKAVLDSSDFDVLHALENHRGELRKRIAHLERLIGTVDDTILHLKGEKKMSESEFFKGFSEEQQAEYEKEAMQIYDPEVVRASNLKWKRYSDAQKQSILDEGRAVYEEMVAAMPKGAASPEAQAGVEHWRRHMAYFWDPNDEQLLGLADMYNEEPRFKNNFDTMHPDLAEFMRQAVKVYVERRRS